MDGDGLPELVFAFPRAESVSLASVEPFQDHNLVADLLNMGNLEYNAAYPFAAPTWHPNESQFARGGVVLVSSHNTILKDPNELNRKAARVVDLHEVGQIFSSMARPRLLTYARDEQANGNNTCVHCATNGPAGGCPPPDPNDPNSSKTEISQCESAVGLRFLQRAAGRFLATLDGPVLRAGDHPTAV